MPPNKAIRKLVGFLVAGILFVLGVIHVFWHPTHEHCIKQVGIALRLYALENGGLYPVHANGYGDALLLLEKNNLCYALMTGPGYKADVFQAAKASASDVPEKQCGCVYIQGLTETNNPEIAILFDKKPNPGDHLHGLRRLWAKPVREVLFLDGSMKIIPESEWLNFSAAQVRLLTKEGFGQGKAEAAYARE